MSSPAIAIIGAGPLGLSAALALSRRGHAVELFDARSESALTQENRTLALSHASRELLELLGAWPAAHATPITRITISQQGGPGRSHLSASEQRLPALGYVLPARELAAALLARVCKAGIPVHHDTRLAGSTASAGQIALNLHHASGQPLDPRNNSQPLENPAHASTSSARTEFLSPPPPEDSDQKPFALSLSKGETASGYANRGSQLEVQRALLLRCEGFVPEQDATRCRDYDQHALLCRATPLVPHQNLAHERFTAQGPIALLPFGKDYAVVWTVPASEAEPLMAAPDADWLAALNNALGGLATLTALSERAHHPLGLRMRREITAPRCVWLGNAAQTLHPVAGQGFNLALRDVWELADTLTDATDPGAPELLCRYAARRKLDREGAAGFTDLLVRGFSTSHPLITGLRGAGLLALEALPPLRHFVAKRMIYGARAWP